MAIYPAPKIFSEVFNLENFIDVQTFRQTYDYAKLSINNVFLGVITFMSDVIIAGRTIVSDLNITNTFLGYDIHYFTGLSAPIQQQFDGLQARGNIISTVSVAPAITVSYLTDAGVSLESISTP